MKKVLMTIITCLLLFSCYSFDTYSNANQPYGNSNNNSFISDIMIKPIKTSHDMIYMNKGQEGVLIQNDEVSLLVYLVFQKYDDGKATLEVDINIENKSNATMKLRSSNIQLFSSDGTSIYYFSSEEYAQYYFGKYYNEPRMQSLIVDLTKYYFYNQDLLPGQSMIAMLHHPFILSSRYYLKIAVFNTVYEIEFIAQ